MKRFLIIALWILATGAFAQKKTRLPEPVNLWDYEEYAPSISADGKTLIFQSGRYGVLVSGANKVPEINSEGHKNRVLNQELAEFFGIFETKLHSSGQWSPPEPIEPINTFSKTMTPVMGGPSISFDGNFLYFFANFPDDKSAFGKEDLYYSVREKYGWSKPINIGNKINTPGYEGFPTISADGNQLYFIREDLTKKALGEERCYRIMLSERDANGEWKRPIELPSPINMDCEKAPRIMADSKTLVFSSVKKKGKGNFDLYMSRLDANGLWSEPKPLDFVNSKYADQSVAISACADVMYYISNGDIYTIGIPIELRPNRMMTIQGYVVDAKSQNPVATRVLLKDLKTGKVMSSIESNVSDGRYTLLAPEGGNYEVVVNDMDYRSASAKLNLQNINHCEVIKNDFKLEKSKDIAKRNDIIIEEAPVIVAVSEPIKKETPRPIITEIKTETASIPEKVLISEESTLKETKTEIVSTAENQKELVALKELNAEIASIEKQIKLEEEAEKEEVVSIPERPKQQEMEPIKVIETEVVTSQRAAPKVVSIVEEERANLTKDTQVIADSLKAIKKNIAEPIKKELYTITLLVRNGENDAVIKNVLLKGKDLKYKFDAERNVYEVEVSESDNVKITISAPGYQSEEYRIQNVNASKRVVIQLFADLPTNLTISVSDIKTGQPLSSNIEVKNSNGEKYTLENPSGKTVMEFVKTSRIELTITAPGYTVLTKSLNIDVVPEGKLYQLDAKLERLIYAIEISAIDLKSRSPIKDVKFILSSDPNGKVVEGINGKYSIPGFGKYMVKSMAPGYQNQSLALDVDNNITTVVFEMVKMAKATKDITLLIKDEYTREILKANVQTNSKLTQNSPPKIQIEEGASDELTIEVPGYPRFKTKVSFTSDENLEIQLKKSEYPFVFRIVSEANRRPVTEARINIVEEKTKDKATLEVQDGVAKANLSPEKNYLVSVVAEGYQTTQIRFQTLQALYDNQKERIISLKPIEVVVAKTETTTTTERIETKEFGVIQKGVSVQLNNIYFDQSSPKLKSESFTELDQLAKVMVENPNINIEVRGYTDNQGDFNKNVQLSKDRCQAVIDYLISKGTKSSRMKAVGRGPLDPVVPNNSEENRSKNRRVEFVVL